MPFITALLDEASRLKLGVVRGARTLHGNRRWVNLFNEAGIPSAYEPDMRLRLRCHAPLSIALESIAARAKRHGGAATWVEAGIVARGLKDGFETVEGLEAKLYPRKKAIAASMPILLMRLLLFAISRNGAFRDVLASGANEACFLSDRIASAARTNSSANAAAVIAGLAMKPEE